jgi:hypothetical protein
VIISAYDIPTISSGILTRKKEDISIDLLSPLRIGVMVKLGRAHKSMLFSANLFQQQILIYAREEFRRFIERRTKTLLQ